MKTPLKIPHRTPENVKQGEPTKQPLEAVRFLPFYVFILLVAIGLGARLFYLQLIRGPDYVEAAKENRISLINIPAPRGVIYDRYSVQLVRNLPSYNVTITPAYLPADSIRLEALYQYVSQLTGVPIKTPPLEAGAAGGDAQPPKGIEEIVKLQESLAPYAPAIIKKNVPAEVALMLRGQQRSWPGVGIEVAPQRDYPTGSLTAHLIGYMGPITREVEDEYKKLGFDPSRDKIGYAGIEAWEQDTLAGKNGYKYIEEDVAGLELRTVGDVVNPVPGNNIKLTIDVRLQASTQAALQRGINLLNLKTNTTKSQIGVAIAMNPITGEILSMVSIPTYDNQRFASFIPVDYYTELLKDPTNPLLNQAIGGQHAPGSVFKIVMAGAALAKGVIDPNRKLNDPGQIVIENKYFPNDPGKARTVVCNKPSGHGDVDMITAISQSCNVYFYKVGGGYAPDKLAGLDIEGIYEYANYFGFNRRTGIELPGERKGLIPNRDYKRLNIGENWSTGDTYIASIGQGYVLATPLQVLNSVTPYLNNGFSVKPTLLKEITDGEGNVVKSFQTQYRDTIPETPEIDPVPLSAYHIDIVRRGMEGVIINGTGEDLDRIEGIQFAGKSGTGEYCDNIAQKKDLCKFGAWPQHAWFLAYAPADKPEIVVVVFVYNGGEGAITAGPVAQQILQAYFELKKTDASRGKTSPLMLARLNFLWAALSGGIFGLAFAKALFEYDPLTFGLFGSLWASSCAALLFGGVAVTTLKTFILHHPALHARRYTIFIPLLLLSLILLAPTIDLTQNLILLIGAVGGVAALAWPIKRLAIFYPLSLLSLIGVFYLRTLAPAVGEADTFEMQVNAIRLGISHGSGYPLYLLLAKLFSLLPLEGTVAFRVNLSSAFFGISAALMIYAIARQLTASRPAAWIAALSFAFSIGLWLRAVEAEVYTLHATLIGVLLWLSLSIQESEVGSQKKIFLLAFIFGLALTNHLTTIILLPSILIALICLIPFKHNNPLNYQLLITKPNLLSVIRLSSFVILLFLLGLSLYLYLPLRWPAINHGETMTWEMFQHFLTGQEAQGALRLNAWYSDGSRYEIVFRKALDQFGWVGMITALIGLSALLRRNFPAALITLAAYAGFAFFALSFYVPDPDYSSFLLPAHLVQAVWMALGISQIAAWLLAFSPQPSALVLRHSSFVVFFLLPASLVWANISLVDKSNDWHFDQLGRYILSQSLKPNAAILADSELIAPLYYLQVAEQIRPDLDIVVLPDEEAYRTRLAERVAKGQTVYLGRYLPRLSEAYILNSENYLAEVSTSPNSELPTRYVKLEQKFGDEIRLHGFALDTPSVAADQTIRLRLYWQALKPPTDNYRVALRLIDLKGEIVRLTNSPSMPVRKMFPTSAWLLNNIVTDFQTLPLDPSLPLDTYRLQVGLFPPFSAKSLGEWITLSQLTVTSPTQAPVIKTPWRAHFTNGIWLMGYEWPATVTPKSPVSLKLFWVLPEGLQGPLDMQVCLDNCRTLTVDADKYPRDRVIESRLLLNAPAASGRFAVRLSMTAAQAECGWLASPSPHCELPAIAVEGAALTESAINFGDRLALESIKLETPTVTPGATVIVTAQWRGLRPMSENYTVFVHLVGPDGLVHGQVDTIPAQGTMLTSSWKPNQALADRFEVRVPADAPKGEYRVEVGWYLLATLDRLAVLENGNEVDDKFMLRGLVVK